MNIANSSFLAQLCLQRPWVPVTTVLFQSHGNLQHFDLHGYLTSLIPSWKGTGGVLHYSPLDHYHHFWTSLSSFLSSIFLFFVFFSFPLLLSKLLWTLHQRSNSKRFVTVDEANSSGTETRTDLLFYASDDCSENGDLVADVVLGGGAFLFLSDETCRPKVEDTHEVYYTQPVDGDKESSMQDSAEVKISKDDLSSDSILHDAKVKVLALEKPQMSDSIGDMSTPSDHFHTPHGSVDDDDDHDVSDHGVKIIIPPPQLLTEENMEVVGSACCHDQTKDGKSPTSSEDDGFLVTVKGYLTQNCKADEHLADNSTAGSTSKSSCEWRGSTHFRDSETDGFFSSSSRRSSSNWESYTVYRKYDEEMMLFDRVSTQKLRETESLRSIKVAPRSISERISHRFNTKRRTPHHHLNTRSPDPYQELEAAYVAQICLAWEALNWNYDNFKRTKCKKDSGCPARVAQQFQQFQVLLQRFIENEPYEYGRRPEVYARMRISSPKLLQVPEFRRG